MQTLHVGVNVCVSVGMHLCGEGGTHTYWALAFQDFQKKEKRRVRFLTNQDIKYQSTFKNTEVITNAS